MLNLNTEVDVVIHAGDLTEESKIDEFRSALRLLKGIKAHLKLVIAGNHDWTMDIPKYQEKVADFKHQHTDADDQDSLDCNLGKAGEARALFESPEAKAAGIVFLDEGLHAFTLRNGAELTVYASPFTCSASATWRFQYTPQEDHKWSVPAGVDVAITHSPPQGVLDRTEAKSRAGSPSLFSAIAKSRPRLHCFGHIHESWGARQVIWREDVDDDQPLTHFTAIDNNESHTIASLQSLNVKGEEYPNSINVGSVPLEHGHQTLFVNAAIEGTTPKPGVKVIQSDEDINSYQPGFIVEMPLKKANTTTASKKRASESDEGEERVSKRTRR